ncbi:MAG: PKD domain-containing protein [Bacteroidetes bacterium]|nr:PKD domain-containing protein [Bacteroidota bacterium]
MRDANGVEGWDEQTVAQYAPLELSASISNYFNGNNISCYTCTIGTTINFDGTASFDPEFSPLTYDWDFDDNGAIASGATVSHTFSPGNVGPVT